MSKNTHTHIETDYSDSTSRISSCTSQACTIVPPDYALSDTCRHRDSCLGSQHTHTFLMRTCYQVFCGPLSYDRKGSVYGYADLEVGKVSP